jgi:hypothetical protein
VTRGGSGGYTCGTRARAGRGARCGAWVDRTRRSSTERRRRGTCTSRR